MLNHVFAVAAVGIGLLVLMVGCAGERAAEEVGVGLGGERLALRPVATFSIVARDGRTGGWGVAVQSLWFSVGAVVPWAGGGVGAVATQSFVDVRYGAGGL